MVGTDRVGLADGEAVVEGEAEGVLVGVAVGENKPMTALGLAVGRERVGRPRVGLALGRNVGDTVGLIEGTADGAADGISVGLNWLMIEFGLSVGSARTGTDTVGLADGTGVGPSETRALIRIVFFCCCLYWEELASVLSIDRTFIGEID